MRLSTIELRGYDEEWMVFKRSRSEARRRELDGLVSRVLLHGRDLPETRLTVTWVEVAPGSGQRPHSHAPEQVYVIVRGRGRMKVGGEERVVTEGDLIHIPPDTIHGIENPADEALAYVSRPPPPSIGKRSTTRVRSGPDSEGAHEW